MADPVSLPTNFLRLGKFPIDETFVVSTYAELTAYATNNPTAYTGQIVAVTALDTAFIIRSDKSVLSLQTGVLSGNWQSTFNLVNSNSANWNSNYSFVNLNSANWNSVYSTYNTNSSLDLLSRTFVNNNSSNINQVTSKVNNTSGNWDSVYSTYNTNSSLYATKQYTANNFLALSGGYVTGDVSIGGNLFLLGSATQINTEDLVLTNSLFYLASGNPSDIVDIGFVGYTSSIDLGQRYTGLVRDSFTKKWVLFSNLSSISGFDININNTSLKVDTLKANIEGDLVTNTNVFGNLSATGNVFGDNLKISSWNDAFNRTTIFSNNSSKYESVFSNVNINSAKYESVFSNVSSNSSKYESVFSNVNANSGKYESVFSNVSSTSSKWEAHNSLFNINSGKYESVFSNVSSNSSKYESVFSNVNANSANWQNSLILNQTNSSFWDSNFLTVCALSSNWNSVYSQTLANSAFWQETYQTVQNNSGTIWNYQGTDLKALSGRWDSNYTTYNTNSSLDLNARTFVNNNSANINQVNSWVNNNSSNVSSQLNNLSGKWESTFNSVCSLSTNWNLGYGYSTVYSTNSSKYLQSSDVQGKYIPLSSVDTQLNINSTNVVQNSAVAKKIQDIENSLNILVDAPSYTQPSATLTSLTTQIEIGTTVNQNITLNWNQGNAGAAFYFRLLRNNSQVQQQATSWTYNVNEVATANTTTFTNVVSYAQGPVLNNALGLPDARGRIETGSKSINNSFTGYYRVFYGAIDNLPANLRNLPKNNHFVTTNAGTTVTMNASEFGTIDKNIIAIAMPSNRSLSEVITNANETITNNFTVSSVFIPDAAGNLVSYKLYRNTTIVPLNIPLLSVKYI